jgi:hypothetical protein
VVRVTVPMFRGALCRIVGTPEDWFPTDGDPGRFGYRAAQACHHCPAAADCFDYALTNRVMGIWAGTNDDDRDDIRGWLDITPAPLMPPRIHATWRTP